jgi:hypothetical protein
MVGGCQKNGEGLRWAVSPSPLIGLPDVLSSASVSALAVKCPRLGRSGLGGSGLRRSWKACEAASAVDIASPSVAIAAQITDAGERPQPSGIPIENILEKIGL